jgi:predicted phosphodiesterase
MIRRFIVLILALTPAFAQFVQKPYLQLGDHPKNMTREALVVMWHAPDRDAAWSAETRVAGKWRKHKAELVRTIRVEGAEPHRVYQAALQDLAPGERFAYRVLLNGKPVFAAEARARPKPGQTYTMALVGDIAQKSEGQRKVAYQMSLAKPDFFVVLGDAVYGRGRVSEYYDKWFPIHNCDAAVENECAPLLRSMPVVNFPGNHDIAPTVDFDTQPDSMAYFYYWSMPLNGPVTNAVPGRAPDFKGPPERIAAFQKTAPNYPRMLMYSFDYGDAHWTMLDSNPYIDWTDPGLREWIRNDLKAAAAAKWRFVGVHHPPFHSSKAHQQYQRMRLVADLFEEGKVDVVFSGHVHNYQRAFPMKFRINPEDATKEGQAGLVRGKWTLDKAFDGKTRTKPNGILWIVTGGGGAGLYNPEQESDPASWQEFTDKFVSTIHSFTMAEISPSKVTLWQIAADGREVDRFTITRE